MHKCNALIVTCIDFRIQLAVEEWSRTNLRHGKYDRAAWAGGVLKFKEIMGQIGISVRLHGIKKVILANHEDCGAYGPAGTLEKHRQDLLSAAKSVKSKYPTLIVETYFVHLDGKFSPID